MKLKGLNIKNFAAYDNVSVSFDPNVTLLVGKNGSGKSGIGLSAIQAAMQGIAEKSSGGNQPLIGERFRFVGKNGRSANLELTLFDEVKGTEIKIIRKISPSGQTLSFEAPEGMELDQNWLNDLFNVFMISPKKFTELSGKDQAIALGIDTSKEDEAIKILKTELTGLNRDMKQFDNLVPVEEVEEIDIIELQEQKEKLRLQLNQEYLENKESNTLTKNLYLQKCKLIDEDCAKFNNEQFKLENKLRLVREMHIALKKEGYEGLEVETWIATLGEVKEQKSSEELYPKEPTDLSLVPDDYILSVDERYYVKEMPDDSKLQELDQKLIAASETNNKALLYKQYQEKLTAKEAKEKEIKDNKDNQATKENDRLEKIKSYKFPFDNLTVNEDGELLLDERPIKAPYFSTGQLLKIVPKLMATTNPELKYIFLQDFNLMDEDLQKDIEEDLTSQGFQLVIEYVGKTKLIDKNCILLKDGAIVESYEEEKQTNLL